MEFWPHKISRFKKQTKSNKAFYFQVTTKQLTAESWGLLVNPYKTFTQGLFNKKMTSEGVRVARGQGVRVGHFTWGQVEKVTLDSAHLIMIRLLGSGLIQLCLTVKAATSM